MEIKLTERDEKILRDLFEYRTLTVKQIHELYFEKTSMNYTYLRLHQLKKAGYVRSQPIVVDGQKRAACYYLTDAGLKELTERDLKEAENVKSHHLYIKGSQRPYVVELNEIYVGLRKAGTRWEVLDSRYVKRMYNLNRANLIQGIITNGETHYGVYLLLGKPEIETYSRIINEIKRTPISDYIVFAKNEESFEMFMEESKKLGLVVGGSLKVLPYKLGNQLLQVFRSEMSLVNKITDTQARPINSKRNFRYELVENGEKKYVVELLTFDLMQVESLQRYNISAYELERQKVKVYVWSKYLSYFQKLFQKYPHIEFISMLTKDVLNHLEEETVRI